MLKTLYGNLKYTKKSDLVILPIKYIYLIYTFPFLIFTLLLAIRSLGAFGNPLQEEIGPIKAVLLHMSAIVISFALWGTLYAILSE